jgi:hypothetical protein
MGRKRDRTGIEGFFDDLTGKQGKVDLVVETKPESKTVEKLETKTTTDRRKTEPKADVERKIEEPPKSMTPTGRPAGKKDGEGPLKRRATLWLPTELVDAYRDRTWEERCHLGELVERALREYQERHWGEKSKSNSG